LIRRSSSSTGPGSSRHSGGCTPTRARERLRGRAGELGVHARGREAEPFARAFGSEPAAVPDLAVAVARQHEEFGLRQILHTFGEDQPGVRLRTRGQVPEAGLLPERVLDVVIARRHARAGEEGDVAVLHAVEEGGARARGERLGAGKRRHVGIVGAGRTPVKRRAHAGARSTTLFARIRPATTGGRCAPPP
jgi:hypothetical protein